MVAAAPAATAAMMVALLTTGAQAQGETRELVMPDGDVRTYILTLPPGYDPAEGAPAVLDFHGAGSSQGETDRGFGGVT